MSGQPPVTNPPGTSFGAVADRLSSMRPDQQDASIQLQRAFEEVGRLKSEEAKGIVENVTFQGAAGAKVWGDGLLNLVHGTHKLMAGLGGGVGSTLTGDGFGKGWDWGIADVREQLRKQYGSEDPSILDAMAMLRNGGDPISVDVFNPETGTVEPMSVGRAGDELIQRRLGNMAAFGQTIGMLGSFATGPGAAIGNSVASTSRIVTGRLDAAIAKSLAKSAGMKTEQAASAFEKAIAGGDALKALGQMPGWKEAATSYQKALRLGGKTLTDTLDITAANVAQSYLLAKDEDRENGMIAAAATSWLAAPLAKLGQTLGERIMTNGLLRSPEQMKALGAIYGEMAAGRMSVKAADEMIGRVVPNGGRVLLANSLTSAIEGTAFLALPQPQVSVNGEKMPSTWDLWKQWQEGDPAAGQALFSMWIGSVAGTAATKYAVPQHLAPMFKSLRPDLNTLKIHMEAEGFRRYEAEAKKAEDAPASETELAADAAAFVPDGKPISSPEESRRAKAASTFGNRVVFDRQLMDARQNGEPIMVGKPAPDAADPVAAKVDETVATYDWATPLTNAALRSGWEPTFRDDGAVRLQFGRAAHATLEERSGTPLLILNEPAMQALRDFGREPAYQSGGHPDSLHVDPAATQKTLDDLALIGQSRSMQGALAFERLGMAEIGPGVFHNPETGAWHTVDLDGKMRTMMPQDGDWSSPEDLVVVGGFGEPDFATEALIGLKGGMAKKVAIAPDPLVDSVIVNAISMAEHGDTAGAKELRQFFSIMDPVKLRSMLTEDGDQWLAHTLGSLATGNNNARNAAREVMVDSQIDAHQESTRVRLMQREKQDRLAADQDAREAFAERLKDVKPKTVGKAPLGTGVAQTIRKWLPQLEQPKWKSAAADIAKVANSDGPLGMGARKQVKVTADEVLSLAESWADVMAKRRQEPFEDTPEARQEEQRIAAVDQWLSQVGQKLGVEPIGETAKGVAIDIPADPLLAKKAGDEPPPSELPPSKPQDPPIDGGPTDGPPAPRSPSPDRVEPVPEPEAAARPVQAPEVPPSAAEQAPVRPVPDLPTTDTQGNRNAYQAEYKKVTARLSAMKKLPQAQRATRGTAKAMDELAAQADRLRRKVNALERQAALEKRRAGRTPEEQQALAERMAAIRRKPETAHAFVAKRGGIKVDVVNGRKVVPKGWPLDSSPEVLAMKVGGKPVFTGTGRPWESVVQDLVESGFFPGKHIHGGDDTSTAAHELLQDWFDSGDSMHSESDGAAMVEQQRQFAAEQRDREVAEKQEVAIQKKRQRAIEAASEKRGVSRRLADVAKMQEASDAVRAKRDAKLPEVTQEQVDQAEDVLAGERMRIEEGDAANLSPEDFLAITRAATPKQKVALANELILEGAAKSARDSGDMARAERLDNLLLTGGAKQIADEAVKIMEPGAVGSMGGNLKVTHAKAIKTGARQALEWAINDRLEILERIAPAEWTTRFKIARSRQRKMTGEAQVRFAPAERALRRMKAAAMRVEMIDGVTPMFRWQALAEGRVQPVNDREKVAAEGLRDAGLYLWEQARAAGVRRPEWDTASAEYRWKPLTERDRFVMPRIHGGDWDRFMGPEANRRRLWQWLIEHNNLEVAEMLPNGLPRMDAGKVVMRPKTADDFEARWTKPKEGAQSAEKEAAFEFVRQIKNFPAMFEGHQLLEANPFEAMRRVIHEQSGRTAAVEQWGQDLSAEARASIEKAEGVTLRPGAEHALREYQQKHLNNTATKGDAASLQSDAKDLLVTLQGRNPKEMSPLFRALYPLNSLANASMTWKSWIQDLAAPFVQGTAYAGFRRMAKAMVNVARTRQEAMIAAERVGSLFRNTGVRDLMEADSPTQKLADAIGWLATTTERIKTAMFDRQAVEMLADWKRGRVTGNDRDVLAEMLLFNGPEQDALTSGNAEAALQERFRHEYVKLTTGRRTRIEGSKALANPNIQQAIRFGNWISGRMVEVQRLMRGFGPDRTMAQRARAAGRLAVLTGGFAASSPISLLIGYMVADAFKGENGYHRLVRDLSYAPAATVGKALLGQVVGGPVAQTVEAIRNPDKTKQWAGLTTPTALLHGVATKLNEAYQSFDATTPGDLMGSIGHSLWLMTGGVAGEIGIVPNDAKNLVAYLQGVAIGQDPNQTSDDRMLRAFRRIEGIETVAGTRDKAPAFYDALQRIKVAIGNSSSWQEAKAAAADDIRTALALGQEESLAAAVRGMQHLDTIQDEKRAKLLDYSGNDEQLARIYAHDLVVRELAREIGKEHGESPTPLAEDLETAQAQARLGATDVWNRLVDRVVDDATFSLGEGQGLPSSVRDLAEAMAPFAGELTWLDAKSRRSIGRSGTSRAMRARMLQTILTRRARERVKADRREKMRE